MTQFGFLNCDKPTGMTSRDVVNVVQRRTGPTKVGHCGTLDPLAQGVLVLGVGPAVRLTSYVQDCRKRYVAQFRLGASSETGDLEKGFIEHTDMPVPTLGQLAAAAQSFVGSMTQTPPAYSAIWINGQRAYKRVRRGERVEMPSRTVSIYGLSILQYEFPTLSLDISCGSGTYIRSLGVDLARSVQSIAVMTKLRRVAVGPFRIEDAVTIDQLKDDSIEQLMVPAVVGVDHLPRVVIDSQDSVRLGNGLPLAGDAVHGLDETLGKAIAVSEQGELRAIIAVKKRGWCPVKVFPVLSGS